MIWMKLNLFCEEVALGSQRSHDHTAERFTLRCQLPLPVVLTTRLALQRGNVAADTCYQHTHGPTKNDGYQLTDGYSEVSPCEI